MTRIVSLGDSVTVGLGDSTPGRGWAGLLAEALAPAELSNLAVSGARVSDVARDQLPRALELRPAIATLLVGVNDTLRADFDAQQITTDLRHLMAELHAAQVTMLTATLPDPGLLLRLPALLRRPLARRIHVVNTAVTDLARRYDTVHLGLARHPLLYEPRMWSVDRLHPSERGHRSLARLFAAGLRERGIPARLPDPEPTGAEPTVWASALWLATSGTAWLARRSRDFLPAFTALVAQEIWNEKFAVWRLPVNWTSIPKGMKHHMRVAIVAESFLPQVNGVTNSVCRILDHLAATGHDALVIAPAPAPPAYAGFPVHPVRSLTLPFYRSVTIGLPSRQITRALADFKPDIVHLASPAVLGATGMAAARRLGLPAIAVFQTDLAGFARQYGIRGADPIIWSWLRRIHRHATTTLAPSTPTLRELADRGIPRLARWGRGVDLDLFHPRHRCERLRHRLAPDGETIVGYAGRLAAEKQPHLLAALADLPGVRLAVVGTGPMEERLRRLLPQARFFGLRTGPDLARILASLDVFLHTGSNETFCQAVQEALASGVPAVAPAAGGPLDLIQPGVNGLLYPSGDPSAMRAAVAALAADPDLRARMAQQARHSVRDRDWRSVCEELLRHYGDVPADEPAALRAGSPTAQT
ncbi:glycosyltransferase [Nonomuraea sp. CA-141351]|uniref:glycosyltransferase n=1 Tax=Nonomuraea sp. CA-141351 TaxID=3239996 RepID=UPI003D9261DA